MDERRAIVAGQFYPAHEKTCRGHIEECLEGAQAGREPGRVVAGIVPHAGWTFSGPTAAKVFARIDRENPPETFILLGAVHHWGIREPSVYSSGSWQTPLGSIAVNQMIARTLVKISGGLIADNAEAHDGEHSIEVQLPFIAYLFPEATIVPLALPPTSDALTVGQIIGDYIEGEKLNAVVIGTTDLTHYGPGYGFAPKGTGPDAVAWVRDVNDAGLIRHALSMESAGVLAEARENHNACGAGAVAGTAAAAKAMGAQKGVLLEYTTSLDAMPGRRVFDFVGYAGIVYALDA